MFAIVIYLELLMCTLTIRSSVLCVLMLSLMSLISIPPSLCNLSVRTVVTLCTLGVLDLGVSLIS